MPYGHSESTPCIQYQAGKQCQRVSRIEDPRQLHTGTGIDNTKQHDHASMDEYYTSTIAATYPVPGSQPLSRYCFFNIAIRVPQGPWTCIAKCTRVPGYGVMPVLQYGHIQSRVYENRIQYPICRNNIMMWSAREYTCTYSSTLCTWQVACYGHIAILTIACYLPVLARVPTRVGTRVGTWYFQYSMLQLARYCNTGIGYRSIACQHAIAINNMAYPTQVLEQVACYCNTGTWYLSIGSMLLQVFVVAGCKIIK